MHAVKKASDIKVGDKVNALVYPGNEVIGEVIKVDNHFILVKNEKREVWSVTYLAKKI